MLRSKPNVKKESILGKKINKLTIRNNSKYEVSYEAYIYEASQVTHRENEIELNIGVFDIRGNNIIDHSRAENLLTERGIIPRNGGNDVTVDGSKKVMLRYFYVGLHIDFTDEKRNFTVYDEVTFEQPSPEKIAEIEEEKSNYYKRIKEAEEVLQIKQAEEVLQIKEAQEILASMPCASTYQHTCTPSCKTNRCVHCNYFYCDWHFIVNNNIIGSGGHICRKI
tara:strand:+ start:118 stop:786 length:669 start_codon:yes stop_codon:yes gene_type:complete